MTGTAWHEMPGQHWKVGTSVPTRATSVPSLCQVGNRGHPSKGKE
jgi:hypothetical protein